MEEKLEKYRTNLRRREKFDKFKQKFIRIMTFSSNADETKKEEEHIAVDEISSTEEIVESNSEISEQPELWSSEDEPNANEETENAEKPNEDSKWKYITFLLWFCFWATCWMIAIELKFGIVYLLFSAIFGIYFNTRTGPKQKNEISAYSVFNENCQSIKGTLTAEQFEREIRYGPTTVK